MKNLTAIWLIFSYLLLSTGVNVPVHVCKMTGKIRFFQAEVNCCGKTGKRCPVKNKSCCEDKILTLKIKSSHKIQAVSTEKASLATAFLPEVSFPDFYNAGWVVPQESGAITHFLPPPKIPVYLRNQALLI